MLPLPVKWDQVNAGVHGEGGLEGNKEGKEDMSCVQRHGSNRESASCPWDQFSSFGAGRNDS